MDIENDWGTYLKKQDPSDLSQVINLKESNSLYSTVYKPKSQMGNYRYYLIAKLDTVWVNMFTKPLIIKEDYCVLLNNQGFTILVTRENDSYYLTHCIKIK